MSSRRLLRSQENRMLFGVAAGLADYLEVDPVLVRLFFVLLTLSTGYGLIIYLLMALLMPEGRPVASADTFDSEEIIIKDVS